MKNLTIYQIIEQLQAQGHEVKFYKRKDRGYVITSINGQRYTGKTGNTIARTMVGATLSQARAYQLGKIRTPKGKKAKKKTPVSEEIMKKLRKVQRLHRKRYPTSEGGISKANIRWQMEHNGEEAALEALDRRLMYESGIAYPENVMYLIDRLEQDLNKKPNSRLEGILGRFRAMIYRFKEAWIYPIYEILYEWEKGTIDGDETARRINSIMSW